MFRWRAMEKRFFFFTQLLLLLCWMWKKSLIKNIFNYFEYWIFFIYNKINFLFYTCSVSLSHFRAFEKKLMMSQKSIKRTHVYRCKIHAWANVLVSKLPLKSGKNHGIVICYIVNSDFNFIYIFCIWTNIILMWWRENVEKPMVG